MNLDGPLFWDSPCRKILLYTLVPIEKFVGMHVYVVGKVRILISYIIAIYTKKYQVSISYNQNVNSS